VLNEEAPAVPRARRPTSMITNNPGAESIPAFASAASRRFPMNPAIRPGTVRPRARRR
jgi:hypothetical protein